MGKKSKNKELDQVIDAALEPDPNSMDYQFVKTPDEKLRCFIFTYMSNNDMTTTDNLIASMEKVHKWIKGVSSPPTLVKTDESR